MFSSQHVEELIEIARDRYVAYRRRALRAHAARGWLAARGFLPASLALGALVAARYGVVARADLDGDVVWPPEDPAKEDRARWWPGSRGD